MAVNKRVDMVNINLNGSTLFRSFVQKPLGAGDINADRFGIRAFRNGEPESLAGCTVIGYFIRADKSTVVINAGAASGNEAVVTLPASCYVVDGYFSLAIKVTKDGETLTTRIVDGTVITTTTDAIIDPGHSIPSVAELMALIDDAEAAAAGLEEFTITNEVITGTRYRLIISTTT